MKNIFDHIYAIIQDEIPKINKKIKGIILLEILKYKIIDKLTLINSNIIINDDDDKEFIKIYDDEYKKLVLKLNSYKLSKSNLNSKDNNDNLMICLKGNFQINIEDMKKNKKFSFKCLPFKGIVMTNNSKYSINFSENSLVLEICIEDKVSNIENIENNTILNL